MITNAASPPDACQLVLFSFPLSMEPRRFPLPWTVRQNADAYWIEDASGRRGEGCPYNARDCSQTSRSPVGLHSGQGRAARRKNATIKASMAFRTFGIGSRDAPVTPVSATTFRMDAAVGPAARRRMP